MKRAAVGLGAIVMAACGSFEDPAIVIDLRVLAMTADVPEQVIPYEPGVEPDLSMLDLSPVTVCALVADPAVTRGLRAAFRLCPSSGDLRCNPEDPIAVLGEVAFADPDTASPAAPPCITVQPDGNLFAVVRQALLNDPLAGFSGVDVELEMTVYADATGGRPAEAIVAGKRLRFAAQAPPERRANLNPSMTGLEITVEGVPALLPIVRCADGGTPLTMAPGASLAITPLEPDGVREDYVVPTFDGGSRSFTETLTYQWLAGDGSWSPANTGGPRDGFGNLPTLDTVWTAPPAEDLTLPARIPLWVVQRDERLGASWIETCVVVQ